MKALGGVLSFLAFSISVSRYFVAVGLIVTVCLVVIAPFPVVVWGADELVRWARHRRLAKAD